MFFFSFLFFTTLNPQKMHLRLMHFFPLMTVISTEIPNNNRIFNAWLDGFDTPAMNGSVVSYAEPAL